MIKIIESDIKYKKCLEKMITKDGTYIDVSMVESPKDMYTSRLGLDYALSELEKDSTQTIVLRSFERPSSLYLDQRFMTIMARAKSYFIREPFLKAGLDMELDTPKYESTALGLQAKVLIQTDRKARLLHDYHHKPAEIIKKEFGIYGTDADIIEQLRAHDIRFTETKGVLPGVFVDIDGTLLHEDKVHIPVVEMMIEYAKTRPVSLWTGGGKESAAKKVGPMLEGTCQRLGIVMYTRIPILDKQLFEGYKPEIVLDDQSEEEFVKDYRIFPQKFIQIS